MKKIILMIAFFTIIVNPCLADDTSSLKTLVEGHMKKMVSTYASTMGKELQLRAIDLYLMGEGLLNHQQNPQIQAKGKEAIKLAERLYQVGKELFSGKEVSAEDMEDWVTRWTVK
ncbi:MAG: hypothetical protein K2W92_03920 [Alphaproteobacteria bacterium]|nr:hypothetical protein [Alphaproteobacteria bacterium]